MSGGSAFTLEHRRDPGPQWRKQLFLEPGVSAKPDIIARTRVWQRDYARPMLAPRPDYIGHRRTRSRPMVRLRVFANDESEFQIREIPHQLLAPRRRALRTRWKISGSASTRKTKPHGEDGYALRVVENFGGQAEPLAKTIATCVCEGHAGLMNLSAGRLAGYQNTGMRMQLEDGSGAERQMLRANGAAAHFAKQGCERRHASNREIKPDVSGNRRAVPMLAGWKP